MDISLRLGFFVALASGLGGLFRFLTSYFIKTHLGTETFLDLWIVNLLGAVLIGFFYALLQLQRIDSSLFIVVGVGFLGGFTTFSAVTLASTLLIQKWMWIEMLGLLLGQSIIGTFLCYLTVRFFTNMGI